MLPRQTARGVLGLCVAMVAAGALLAISRRSAGVREAGRRLGIAVLGNGRLLAAEDAEGTIVDLFWPRPGQWQQIASGSRAARRAPVPVGGIDAGIEIGGRVRWLRDASRSALLPNSYPARIAIRFEFEDGIVVTQQDVVMPDRDVLLREYEVTHLNGSPAECDLLLHAPLSGASGMRWDARTGTLLASAAGVSGATLVVGEDVGGAAGREGGNRVLTPPPSLWVPATLRAGTRPWGTTLPWPDVTRSPEARRRGVPLPRWFRCSTGPSTRWGRPRRGAGATHRMLFLHPGQRGNGTPRLRGTVPRDTVRASEHPVPRRPGVRTPVGPETSPVRSSGNVLRYRIGAGHLRLAFAFGPPAIAVAGVRTALAVPDRRAYAAAHQNWAAFESSVVAPAGPQDGAAALLYRRSLDALRALTDRESGAVIAGARPGWAYCWPRDAVFAAVAYDLAGRHREAERIYDFLARAAPGGEWAARYWADGTPVRDGRPPQLDAAGLFVWGVWMHAQLAPGSGGFSKRHLPAAGAAAERILASLDPATGLPGPGFDANEAPPAAEYATNAAACFAGLRAAAQLAEADGRTIDAGAFRAAAERIRAGVRQFLWSERDRRFRRGVRPESRGLDLLMLWLSEPFGVLSPTDPRMRSTAAALRDGLRLDDGLCRGLVRSVGDEPWLHQNELLACYLDAAGERAGAERLDQRIVAAATPLGTLPERVDPVTLLPTSTTPLAWSHAMFVILAWQRAGRSLPVP